MQHVDPMQIKPDASTRMQALVGDFAGQSQGYYRRVFAHMMQAPGYAFTLNPAAGLLGPVWFGARGLWSWFLGVLLFFDQALLAGKYRALLAAEREKLKAAA